MNEKGEGFMPRIRKEPNRYWSKEEKLRIINLVLNDGLSTEQGENALENKKKPGNPLIKYSRRKELTQIEQLEYENMKLRIENERLKKGYILKGDGSVVIFK